MCQALGMYQYKESIHGSGEGLHAADKLDSMRIKSDGGYGFYK